MMVNRKRKQVDVPLLVDEPRRSKRRCIRAEESPASSAASTNNKTSKPLRGRSKENTDEQRPHSDAVKTKLNEKLKLQTKKEVKKEVNKEVKKEMKKEMKKEVKKEMKKEMKKEKEVADPLDSETSDVEEEGTLTKVSEYEKKRLENLKANAEFFAQLGILQAKQQLQNALSEPKTSQPSQRGIGQKRNRKKSPPPRRPLSLRLRRINPEGLPLPPLPEVKPEVYEDEHPRPPAGPLPMEDYLLVDDTEDLHKNLLNTMKTCGQVKVKISPSPPSLPSYMKGISGMRMTEKTVAKVVPQRIFSVAIHPTTEKVLVAAGDKWGKVGLWDVLSEDRQDGVLVYKPHSRPVNCVSFPLSCPEKLYSCSYDGSLRCGDFNKAVFDEVSCMFCTERHHQETGPPDCQTGAKGTTLNLDYCHSAQCAALAVYSVPDDEDILLRNFDFLTPQTLLVARIDGCVAVVDTRTKGCEAEHVYELHKKNMRTVSVHPLQKNFFVTASTDATACLWDLRRLKEKSNSALDVMRHGRSVDSAYFSPVTGCHILTSSADDHICVYNVKSSCASVELKRSIRHNNHTGRWLTKFRPTWHPLRDDLFVTGSMHQPRQIELYSAEGCMERALQSEFLGSVCSLNEFHPTRNVLVGGNSSGRLHVFM